MWVELLTDRINNELGKSNLINEHALIPEPFPLKSQEWQHQVSPNNNKYKKNIRARENKMKQNSCTPINPKKYSCYGFKKIIQGIPAAWEFPIPP